MKPPWLFVQKVETEPHHWAIDCETSRFRIQKTGWKAKTSIEPFGGHELVLGSICGGGFCKVYHREELLGEIEHLLLNTRDHLVFHNCAFDIPVFCRACPPLKPLFIAAVNAGQVHDTFLLELVGRLARGSGVTKENLFSGLRLDDFAKRYVGMKLNKDEAIRLEFGQFLNDTAVPERFLEYAAQDAIATAKVYKKMRAKYEQYAEPEECRYPALPDAKKKFGLLDEISQVKGALGLAWLQQFPLRVDTELARTTRDAYQDEAERLKGALIQFKFGSCGPKTGKFKLSHKTLMSKLEAWAKEQDIVPERTDTGRISLKHDDWAGLLPRASGPLLACPKKAVAMCDKLSVWLRFARVRKLLNTYLHVYACSEVHFPRYMNIGARTTRMSASKPNIQNIPKRNDGIRGLFMPQKGYKLIEADYVSAELVALAQTWHLMYGGSNLEDALNGSEDAHVATARKMFAAEWGDASPAERKQLRQTAKAVSFGLPGGLGARKFTDYARRWGVDLNFDDARALRRLALDAEPALRAYLSDERSATRRLRVASRNLGCEYATLVGHLRAWRDEEEGTIHGMAALKRLFRWSRNEAPEFDIPTPPGFDRKWDLWKSPSRSPTGCVRGNSSYTQAHNHPFQAAVASALKDALFRLWSEWTPDASWNPVCCVHDSVLVEARPSSVTLASMILERCMVDALKQVCPDIRCAVDLEVKDRWGKMADAQAQTV